MTDASVEAGQVRRFTARRRPEAAPVSDMMVGRDGPVYLVVRMVSGTEYRVPHSCLQLAQMAMIDIAVDLKHTIGRAGTVTGDFSPVRNLSLDGGRQVQIIVLNVESMEIVPADVRGVDQ